MPAIAAITLADGQSTPVNHTFTPIGRKDNLVEYADTTSSTVIGRPRLMISTKRTQVPTVNNRTQYKIVVPVVDSVTNPGSPFIVNVPLLNIEVANLESVPDAVLKDLVAYGKGILAHSITQSLVVGREAMF